MFSSRKTSAPASGALALTKSLRFRSSASAYLNRTAVSPTLATKFTVSFWTKIGVVSSSRRGLITSISNAVGTSYWGIEFNGSNGLTIYDYNNSSVIVTNQVFADSSSWYHIVVSVDTTQATASNRVLLYVNGTQVTSFSSSVYPTQNSTPYIQVAGNAQSIASWMPNSTPYYYDGYIAEVNFIDGQALTPSSFGATNATIGQWSPAIYSGSYGTNGFHLTFANATSTTTLGYDTSGNANNWTTNNISLTAGSTYDSMNDVPVAYSATAANYAVMNPNDKGGYTAFANGNLQTSNSTTVWTMGHATIGMTTGKWYWECYPTTAPNTINFLYGISTARVNLNSGLGFDSYGWSYYKNGDKYTNNVNTAYGASWTLGDTIGVAFDADAGTLTFYKNGTSQGTAFSGLTSGPYFPSTSSYDSNTAYINFGQQPFTYTPPSGYVALNTYNLPTPSIAQGNKYMDVVLRIGTGSTGGTFSTNVNMANGALVWEKPRSNPDTHELVDSVRGISKILSTNATTAEATDVNDFTVFGTNFFTIGNTDWPATRTIVDWIWAANGTAVSNTSGTITSSVSANTTAGFSIVTYTGNGTQGATVGHGIGATPYMIITFNRTSGGNHVVYHVSLTTAYFLRLNTTDAQVSASSVYPNAPSSSTFTIGNDSSVNTTSANYVAYCFAPIAGFSAFGSYTGNGSATGPFIYCGFQPKFIMTKRTNTTGDWFIWDSARNTYNSLTLALYPDLNNAEYNYGAVWNFTSNGFYPVSNSVIANNSGDTYIYMAFASNPFKYANAF